MNQITWISCEIGRRSFIENFCSQQLSGCCEDLSSADLCFLKLWICIWSARDDINTNHAKIDSLSIYLYLYLFLSLSVVSRNVEQLDKLPLHKTFLMNMNKAANVTKVEICVSIFYSMQIMTSIFFSFIFEAQFFHLLS